MDTVIDYPAIGDTAVDTGNSIGGIAIDTARCAAGSKAWRLYAMANGRRTSSRSRSNQRSRRLSVGFVEKPLSITEFQSECKTKHHPRDLGVAVCSRPGPSGAMEECVLVRVPGESRLEIVTEESVETTEALLVGADNLEESHADGIADMLNRQMLRKFQLNAPTLEELRDQVREQPRDQSSGASEPVAAGAVRVGGGGNAALRTRLASPERVMATAPAGQDGQGKSGKRTRSGAAQPAAKRKKAPAVAGDVLPPSEGSAAGKSPPAAHVCGNIFGCRP